jgi:peptidoglycan L-alanyl-D-glutamate endopeptidase CwlK
MIDSRDENYLHPVLKKSWHELKYRAKHKNIDLILTSTYRDGEYQDYLYSQGRTRPGNIVTNAKSGESIHNYGLSFDFAPIELDGNINWSSSNKKWNISGEIWMNMGGDWGGIWNTLVDLAHCEFTGELTINDLQKGLYLDNNIKMKWEIEMEEILKKIKDIENKLNSLKYKKLEDMPEWSRDVVKKLIDNGLILGTGDNLDLSEEALRLLVINDRMGLYK